MCLASSFKAVLVEVVGEEVSQAFKRSGKFWEGQRIGRQARTTDLEHHGVQNLKVFPECVFNFPRKF